MNLFRLREEFSREGIMVCFNGPLSHSIIEEIGTAIRNHLAAENLARSAVQDVFAVYIELTQNARNYLSRHGKEIQGIASATITVAKKGEAYAVTAGNIIRSVDGSELQQRLDAINTMTPGEIKTTIRQQLRRDIAPDASGAGIGLLDMARRSHASPALTYSIQPLTADLAFVTVTVLVQGDLQ